MKNFVTILIIVINIIAIVILAQLATFDEMSNNLASGGLVKGHPNQFVIIPILALVASFCLNIYQYMKLRNAETAAR